MSFAQMVLFMKPSFPKANKRGLRIISVGHWSRASARWYRGESLPVLPASVAFPLYRPLARERIAIIVFIAFLGAFYFSTLREGQLWGDDFAMYIMQARNISQGDWSAPSGYVYNPHFPHVGPPAYPPLFPLMLSPLYKIWGLNLTPMKIEVVLFFLAGLYLTFEFLSRQAPFLYAGAIVVLLGLSPYFWEFKESVVSDLPFFFFSFLTLCVLSACDQDGWKSSAAASAAAGCVYLCFATRAAGVVFIPCLLLSSIPRPGETRRKAQFATAAAVLLIGFHSFVFRSLNGYVVQLGGPWSGLYRNLVSYSWALRHRLFGLGSDVFSWGFLLVLLALGGIGLTQRLRRGVSAAEVFTVAYALIVLGWSNSADLRFLIPILPMWLLYVSVALRNLPRRAEFTLAGVLVAVMIGGYASRFSAVDFGPIREGLGNPAFAQICEYIRSQTPERSVIVYDRPRLLAMLSGRHASAYHEPADDRDLWNYFGGISARYVLVDREYPDDREYLEPLLRRNSAGAQEAHVEGSFHLYALR